MFRDGVNLRVFVVSEWRCKGFVSNWPTDYIDPVEIIG